MKAAHHSLAPDQANLGRVSVLHRRYDGSNPRRKKVGIARSGTGFIQGCPEGQVDFYAMLEECVATLGRE
jgi:hypothetical protein